MAIVYLLAIGVCATAYRVSLMVPFVARNLHAFVAAVFLYTPVAIMLRRRLPFAAYGLGDRSVGRSLMMAAVVALVVFPLFGLGFYAFQVVVCAHGSRLATLAVPGQCLAFLVHRQHALATLKAPSAWWLAQDIVGEVVVVALPEELFFRGYLQKRLEEAFPPRRRVAGGAIGAALVAQAVLFGLGHFLIDLDPRRLAVAAPALLFGWMRSRSDSVTAGTAFHASCNLYMEALAHLL